MAFIQRDFLGPNRAIWNNNTALYKTFRKAFGTRLLDDVEVFNRVYLYDRDNGGVTQDKDTKRFLNKLGMKYTDIQEQSYEGIQRMFIAFDSKKYNFNTQTRAELLNEVIAKQELDKEFSIKITYGGDSLRYFNEHDDFFDVNGVFDINLLISKLDSNPVKFYAANELLDNDTKNYSSINYHTQKKTTIASPISIKTENNKFESLALLDDGTHFERTNVRGVTFTTNTTKFEGNLVGEVSFVLDYKVIKIADNENSVLIDRITEISDNIKLSMEDTVGISSYNTLKSNSYVRSPNSVIKTAIIDFQPFDENIFYDGDQLRVDAVENLKKSEFRELLGKIITIDYEERPTPWYKKVLMVIVVVVAIMIAAATGGSAAPLVALSLQLGAFSISLTVGMLLVNEIGPATSLGTMGRVIGKVAQISGIAASLIGAFAAIQAVVSVAIKNMASITLTHLKSAATALNNLYGTYETLTAEEVDSSGMEEQSPSKMDANDIMAYREYMMETDAINRTQLFIEKNNGLNKTEAIKAQQCR